LRLFVLALFYFSAQRAKCVDAIGKAWVPDDEIGKLFAAWGTEVAVVSATAISQKAGTKDIGPILSYID
jgi:hypothetical protein